LKIPNSNIQIPNKFEIPISGLAGWSLKKLGILEIGFYLKFGIWCLEFFHYSLCFCGETVFNAPCRIAGSGRPPGGPSLR
jgi:hypothetical protein